MGFVLFAADVPANQAAQANAGTAGILALIVPYLIFFMILYFLMILPQKKKAKKHEEMISALKEGDAVITSGGIKGEIAGVTEEFFEVRVDKGTKLTIRKSAVQGLYEKK